MKVFYRFGIRGNNGWRHLIDNSLHCPDIWITSEVIYLTVWISFENLRFVFS